jgi:pimeloyl-ACP methyl ester carboxylesterase
MDRRGLVIIVALSALAAPAAAGRASGQEAPAAPTLNAQRAGFAIFVRGAQVGREDVEVSRDGSEWVVKASSRVGPPINFTLRQAEARYGPDLEPRRLVISGQLRDQPIEVTATVAGGTVTNTVLHEGRTIESAATLSPGAVLLPNNFFGAYTVLAARLLAARPGEALRVYVAPQGEVDAAVREVADGRFQTAARTFATRRYGLSFRNPSGPLDAQVEVETDGRLVRVAIPAASLDVVREDVASVAARQLAFYREGDEDVRVAANGFSLAATISRPRAAAGPSPAPAGRGRPAGPRLPAVVLVAGSGALDRDETVAGIPVFGQLAAALADAGFLVLRYDKRGVGQSGGRAETATLADYADDLVHAVRYLAERRDVDPRRIAVVGHSEGAWVAMLAAAREKKIGRLVLLAGAGTTGAELVLEQQRHALEKLALSAEEKARRVALQKQIHAALLEGGSWDGIPEELRRQADTPWFASLLAFDPARAMARVRQPVLVVSAALDTQVPRHHGDRLLQAAAARKKNPGADAVTIPGVNHLFVPAATGEVDEYGTLADRSIAPELPRAIAEWLHRT